MFHVPEAARVTDRNHPLATTSADGNNGAFFVDSCEPGWQLALICSDGTEPLVPEALDWEHVSVHAFNRAGKQRTPSWREMCFVKDLCWDGDDVVVQFHPRKRDYVNNHPNTLHMWRHRTQPFETPPTALV